MIRVLTCMSRSGDWESLKREYKDQAALLSEDSWDFPYCSLPAQAMELLEKAGLVDIINWELSDKKTLSALEEVRKAHSDPWLLLLADQRISPMAYLRPQVLPTSLLLVPYTKDQLREVIHELVTDYMASYERTDEDQSILVETRNDRIRIPFSAIYYVEAREKKVFIRTRNEEYGFYETMEQLMEKLPDRFRRCHRSYIVNMDRVRNILSAEGMLLLDNDLVIPVSRSCKKDIRTYIRSISG